MTLQSKRYSTIVIDPPFPISLTGKTNVRPNRRTKLPYKTMTLDEIKGFPIDEFAEIGAHVYMWTNNKMLRHTWDIFTAWDVNYHLVMPWVKPTSIPPIPTGYKFASEFLVLGFYGKPMQKFTGRTLLNWLKCTTKRDGHSSKPDEWYDLIKEKSPGPRIDIFARKRHIGFDAWGDEVEPTIQEVLSS